VKRPEDVLNDVVLCRPEAADWLANCLSVSRMMYYLKLGSPKVWMLTGIQYLTDVVVSTSHRKSKNVGVSIEAPLPDPTGIAISLLTGLSTAGMEARIQHQSKTDVAYSHEGERIWAAQFAPLDVRYIKKGVEGEKRLPGRILLKALPDLKHFGVRYGSPMMEEEDKDESDEENVDIKDTVANVTGLDWDKVRKMDEDPSLIQNDMLAVDWLTLGRYLHDSNRKH
jgi:hypothetical protein